MKKSQNLLLLKVLFGIVHLLVFGFVLYTYLTTSFEPLGAIIIFSLIVSDALFMQYIIRKDEKVLSDS